MNDLTRKRLDDLAQAMTDVSPERLDTITKKSERVNIRVTATEKVEMQETAESLDLSLSEYLSALHRFAMPRLSKGKRRV